MTLVAATAQFCALLALQAPAGEPAPRAQPELMPYLASTNLYGSTCLQQDALVQGDPLSAAAQAAKTALAGVGVNYAIWQSYDFVAMSGTVAGRRDVLNYYSFNSYLTWNVFQTDELSGSAGWLTVGGSAGTGFGYDGNAETAQANMGVIGYPLGTDYGDMAFLYQLAWQQSFLQGQLVVTVGLIDPEMYLDLNTYANNQYNQLINYEFVNPASLPWSYNSLGAVVQWQPADWFYAIFASAANNTASGQSPFTGLSSGDWTNTLELGFVGADVLGMGRGVFRVLPFWGTSGGTGGGGVLLNAEQELGRDSPFGAFLRAGFTGRTLGSVQGASSTVAGGLVLSGPSESPLLKTQQAYLAIGGYWLEAPTDSAISRDEYGLELTYVVQLTETLTLQPDVQVILDPAENPDSDATAMFTLQLTYTW